MRFGLFGTTQSDAGNPGAEAGQGFRSFVEFNVEAEALGYHSSFVVEHHFSGWNQISATLNLLTWIAVGSGIYLYVFFSTGDLLADQPPVARKLTRINSAAAGG